MKPLLCISVLVCALASGCSSPPVLELQEARGALAAARDSEADIYAPDQYDLALMNLEMAEIEIEDQEEVASLGRSYDRALAFIDAAIVDAEQAQMFAEDFKAQVFLQAESNLPIAQTALDDAFDVLGRARPFLVFREAQTLEAELSELAVSMNLARQLMEEGGFADAATRLEVIIERSRAIDTRARFVIETAPQ